MQNILKASNFIGLKTVMEIDLIFWVLDENKSPVNMSVAAFCDIETKYKAEGKNMDELKRVAFDSLVSKDGEMIEISTVLLHVNPGCENYPVFETMIFKDSGNELYRTVSYNAALAVHNDIKAMLTNDESKTNF